MHGSTAIRSEIRLQVRLSLENKELTPRIPRFIENRTIRRTRLRVRITCRSDRYQGPKGETETQSRQLGDPLESIYEELNGLDGDEF